MNIDNTGFLVINVIIILLYVLSIISSYKKGLIFGLISFVYVFVALGVSWFLTPIVSNKIMLVDIDKLYNLIDISPIVNYCCWFAIIFFILLIIYLILSPLLKNIPKLPVIGVFDRIGGVLFGIINGTILVIMLNLILSTPLFKNTEEIRNNTLLKYADIVTSKIVEVVSTNIDIEEISKQIKELNVDDARDAFKQWLEEQGLLK